MGQYPEGSGHTQEACPGVNLMKLSKVKCRVLQLGHGNSWNQHILAEEQTKSSPAKDLWVLVDELDTTHLILCPGLHPEQCGQQVKEEIFPLYSTLLRPHTEYYIQLWDPQHRNDTGPLEQVQRKPPRWPEG